VHLAEGTANGNRAIRRMQCFGSAIIFDAADCKKLKSCLPINQQIRFINGPFHNELAGIIFPNREGEYCKVNLFRDETDIKRYTVEHETNDTLVEIIFTSAEKGDQNRITFMYPLLFQWGNGGRYAIYRLVENNYHFDCISTIQSR